MGEVKHSRELPGQDDETPVESSGGGGCFGPSSWPSSEWCLLLLPLLSGAESARPSSWPHLEGAGDDSRRGLEGRFEVSADGDGFDPMSLNSIAVRDLYTGRTYSVVFTRSACRICPLDD